MFELHGVDVQKNIIKKFEEAVFEIKKFLRLKNGCLLYGSNVVMVRQVC
jgi:hypothetical protein